MMAHGSPREAWRELPGHFQNLPSRHTVTPGLCAVVEARHYYADHARLTLSNIPHRSSDAYCRCAIFKFVSACGVPPLYRAGSSMLHTGSTLDAMALAQSSRPRLSHLSGDEVMHRA
jgi:hypothetical protein